MRRVRKMQDVSFAHVDECLAYLPREELVIVEKLRSLIYQAIPHVTEKLSYNVPFYKGYSNICFIWPPAIPWGSNHPKAVQLGFTKGYLIPDEAGYLNKGNRKQVYCKDFCALSEIDETQLLTFLSLAAQVDDQIRLSKK